MGFSPWGKGFGSAIPGPPFPVQNALVLLALGTVLGLGAPGFARFFVDLASSFLGQELGVWWSLHMCYLDPLRKMLMWLLLFLHPVQE